MSCLAVISLQDMIHLVGIWRMRIYVYIYRKNITNNIYTYIYMCVCVFD